MAQPTILQLKKWRENRGCDVLPEGMTFTVDCGVKETLSPQSSKQTATEHAFGNLSYHTRTHKNNDEPHGMKELNQENNALHQTPEYIPAY